MITIQLTDEERNSLLACIESAVKHAPNSLQAAASLLPLAIRIQQAKPDETPAE
jgi:hypothetical protein